MRPTVMGASAVLSLLNPSVATGHVVSACGNISSNKRAKPRNPLIGNVISVKTGKITQIIGPL